uniref:TRPM SLOG domain-containing protein n=1 Tax=Magallana gigas TaxID=29159 RepID=A0A8W8NSN5_MAGGI
MMVMVAETLSYTNHETLVESTKKDQQLQILKQVICQGWPERKCDVPLEVMPFWDFCDELSSYNGLIIVESKPATYVSASVHPRFYIVEAGSQGRTYRRNNCKLMKTKEDPHVVQPKYEGFASPTLEVPIMRNPSANHLPPAKPKPASPEEKPKVEQKSEPVQAQDTQQRCTRFGRAVTKTKYFRVIRDQVIIYDVKGHYNPLSTIDVDALWKNIREEVNTTRKPKINERNIENQTNQLYENRNNAVNINSTPTMVFSVIGDSDSFVPRPWPTTLFQTALIEAAKSGGETWILFRENDEVVSNVIQEAYEHYEAMEFGRDRKDIGDPNRHVKLINIAGKKINHPSSDTSGNINTNFHSYENKQAVYEINVGDGEDQLLEFEKYISKQEVSFFSPKMNIKMPVPIAIIVCEGDLKTIVHIAKALKENIPVIIMKGSGKAADLVLDYIDKNDEFRRKASIAFGIQFDNDKYGLLQEYLGEIIKHKDLVGVFDLDHDDPLKLSNIVGETVVSCWSMEHVIATTDNAPENSETKEDTSGQGSSSFPDHGRTLKGFSLTWKLLLKNSISPEENILNQSLEGFKRESRPHVLNPKYSTPTSLPLYFYFVYQLLQESKRLEECGPVS